MEDLWRFGITMVKGKGSNLLSGVRRSELEEFAKRCDPKAEINIGNIDTWVLRFVVEEKDYAREDIESIKITETETG